MKIRKITALGLLSALAFGLSYIEFLIPFESLGIPGIKLGLANLAVMAALWLFGVREGACVSLVRLLLAWFFFGNATAFLYAAAGAVCSLTVMALLKKTKLFGILGVSVSGAVSHNTAQLLTAALLTETDAVLWYLPVLIAAGVAAGAVNGGLLAVLLRRLGKEKKTEKK